MKFFNNYFETFLLAAWLACGPHRVAAQQNTDVYCYNNSGNLTNKGTNIYQTQGQCHSQCGGGNFAVWATTASKYCWCGNDFPETGEVDYDSNCNMQCLAWNQTCGGAKAWTFGLTGVNEQSVNNVPLSANVPVDNATPITQSHSSLQSPQQVTVTSGQTIVVTASNKAALSATSSNIATSGNERAGSSGGSKAGLAAGIVVGLVLVIALGVGIWLLYRRRRRTEAEEEYRNAISNKEFVNSITAHKPSSDQRLDQVMVQQRRLSDGSIADNQDFSRRILKITNPDA